MKKIRLLANGEHAKELWWLPETVDGMVTPALAACFYFSEDCNAAAKKPAPGLTQGGNRFSEKIMLRHKLERDVDAKNHHHAPVFRGATRTSFGRAGETLELDVEFLLSAARAGTARRTRSGSRPRSTARWWPRGERCARCRSDPSMPGSSRRSPAIYAQAPRRAH